MEIKEIDDINIERLIQGYQYSYLPEGFLLNGIEKNMKRTVTKILNEINENEDEIYCYKVKNGLIDLESLTEISSPSYIFNFGAEPISFFDFKKNGSYREIQIPNLIFYVAFMYNSIVSSEEIFNKIYMGENDFVKYSNSYVVFEKEFTIYNNYEGIEDTILCGEFAPRNSKMVNQLTAENKAINYLEKMSSKLYVLKMDIESFYTNIYTHLLAQIKNKNPYKDLIADDHYYFDFLDKYNMKINSNQTKGIMSGCFSSRIASELLMLCVDYEISTYIRDKDVEYIRYVDDFTFFSDSKEQLQSIIAYVQKILNKYKLRINHSKTEISENILFENALDFNSIDHDFELIKEIWNNYEDFIQLKGIFKTYLKLNKISELKVILSRIAKKIKKEEFGFELFKEDKMSKYMINYLLQLVFYDPNLAVNCYKVLYELFEYYKSHFLKIDQLIECMTNKTKKINEQYSNTLIQIWHYYLLNKFGPQKDIPDYFFSLLNQTDEQNETVNPLVLMTFIEKGDNKNKEIFKYIIDAYKKDIDVDTDDGWKSTIMLSKWWLPLMQIRHLDNKDYHKFYSSKHYHSIRHELSEFLL